MKSTFNLGRRTIGEGPLFIIAEVAQAHDGSLGMAHAYIDAIAATDVDAVKFQTHIADAESTEEEPWRVKFSLQDETRYEYWQRMEFTEEQWAGLKNHAEKAGLIFLSSPFSIEAVELLERIGMPAWKIASGEVNNLPMLDRIADIGKPIILSSGMSSWSELDAAVERIRKLNLPLAVLQCTSKYPCPPEETGLNLISKIRDRYGCTVGLSDHSGTIYPGIAAAALGADVLEVHVTMSREMFGPDGAASVTTDELGMLVRGVRFVNAAMSNQIDKNEMASEMSDLRSVFTKSLVGATDLAAGTVLQKDHLTAKKPGSGIPVTELENVVGRRLKMRVHRGEILTEDHIEKYRS